MSQTRKVSKLKGRVTRVFANKMRLKYYKSDIWANRRSKHLEFAGNKSELSGNTNNLQVHHCKYPIWYVKPYFDMKTNKIVYPNPESGLGKEKHYHLLVCTESEHLSIHSNHKEIWNSKKLLIEALKVNVD